MLALGVSSDSKDCLGDNAAHVAAYSGSVESLLLLREKGVNLNAPGALGMTPLMVASRQDNFKSVQALLVWPEVDLDAQDETGRNSSYACSL